MKSFKEKNDNKNIIYEELISFSKNIKTYFEGELKDYSSLINFIEHISSGLKQISSKIKLPKDLSKEIPDKINIISFYSFHSSIFWKFLSFSEKLDKDVLSQLKNYKQELEKNNDDIYNSIKSISGDISKQKNIINQRKKEFKNGDKKDNNKKLELYKKEIESMNKLLSQSEQKFKTIKIKFEQNEMTKKEIISKSLHNYFILIQDFFSLIDNQKNEVNNLINKFKEKQDKKSIKDIFPNLKINNMCDWGNNLDDWEELKLEENETEKPNETNNINIKDENNNINKNLNEYYIPQITINNNIIGINDEYMLINSEDNNNKQTSFVNIIEDEEKIKDNITIKNFLYGLLNDRPKNDLLLNIEDIFGRNNGNKKFYISFCDKLMKALGDKKTLYEFKLFSNLIYLTNVLNLILENIKDNLLSKKISEEYFDSYKIFDKIICIGERAVHEETYMCAFLNKNKIFKDKQIWINCIKNKIINLLNDLCTMEYLSKAEDSIFRPMEFINKKIQLKKFIGKIDGLIYKKEKNLIESCGFHKSIEYYYKLSKEQRKNVDNNALSIFHGIIKCYIRHITNYNFNVENKADIISEIIQELKIKDDEFFIFYCYYYQDCLYTSKKYNRKKNSSASTSSLVKEKINYIKSEKKDKKIPENYIIDKLDDSHKYYIIKRVCKFLCDEDKLKLICLGKYYSKIKKYIYKSFLKKDISLKRRLNIWKSYLNFNTINSMYNYKDILKETKSDFFQKGNEKSIKQITKDINRTYLKERNQQTAQVIYNVLISFVYSENNIKYIQGMNSITGFIYDLTHNEEDTFHLLICIFSMTQLRDIYEDEDFQNLKTFFYTMERLVYLYLPKVFSKLKDNNIQISFFISGYFITFYTILYSSLPQNDASFLLHLWDDFFLEGWCSFFSSWLAILKYHEKEIVSMGDDKLINYLTNTIKDSDLFRKEKYKEFHQLKKKFKITEELVKNLQDEISVEVGIRKVGTSTIIEDFNSDNKGIVN